MDSLTLNFGGKTSKTAKTDRWTEPRAGLETSPKGVDGLTVVRKESEEGWYRKLSLVCYCISKDIYIGRQIYVGTR